MANGPTPPPDQDLLICELQTEIKNLERALRFRSEASFRRGYSHGYGEALDNIRARLSSDDWEYLAGFFDDVIMEWRYAWLRRDSDPGWEPPRLVNLKERKASVTVL